MMRVQVTIDSATPQQVYDATLALQRTAGIPRPTALSSDPQVRVAGSCMTWTSPQLTLEGADALLREMRGIPAAVTP